MKKKISDAFIKHCSISTEHAVSPEQFLAASKWTKIQKNSLKRNVPGWCCIKKPQMHRRIFFWCTFSSGLFEKQLSHQISGFCQRGASVQCILSSICYKSLWRPNFCHQRPDTSSPSCHRGCLTVLLSYCVTVLLSYCVTVLLSYCLNQRLY